MFIILKHGGAIRPTKNTIGTIGESQDFHLLDIPSNFLRLYHSKSLQLLNISKEDADADSPFMSSYSYNLSSKGRWREGSLLF
jgi:hypothetical protein